MNDTERIEIEDILRKQFEILKLTPKEHQIQYVTESRDLNKKGVDRLSECTAFDRVLKKAFEAREPPARDDYAVVKLAQFLWIYENVYMECVNNLCYLLTCNCHDLLNEFANTYAESVEDIENVSVSAKLTFLRQHGIKIFNRKIDRDLRNAIAHQRFSVKNGKIQLGKGKIDIQNSSQELIDFATAYINLYNKCFNQYYRNLDADFKDTKL
jgi:hypothetical protein